MWRGRATCRRGDSAGGADRLMAFNYSVARPCSIRIWTAFILVGFVAAVVQLLQGDLDIFARVLNGLFDTARPASTFRSAWSAS